MKKKWMLFLLALCVSLTACASAPPERTADGLQWGSDWTTVGNLLGVEPKEGWTLSRSEDMLAASGTYYAAFIQGAPTTYENEEGQEVTVYDAEIHLVLMLSGDDAEKTAGQWRELVAERYPDAEQSTAECTGKTVTISSYPFPAGNGPATLGASASLVHGGAALEVDVITLAEHPEKPAQVLADFLSRCHFPQE